MRGGHVSQHAKATTLVKSQVVLTQVVADPESLQPDLIIQRFRTHSFRRGGAQALCWAGWSLEASEAFGRWLSGAIELSQWRSSLEPALGTEQLVLPFLYRDRIILSS